MLGHASAAAMTLGADAGLFDDDLDGVADRMDALGRAAVAHLLPKAPVVALAAIRERGCRAMITGVCAEPPEGVEPSTYALRGPFGVRWRALVTGGSP